MLTYLELERRIKALEGVVSIHDVHLWSMDGEKHIMTLHVVTIEHITIEALSELKTAIRKLCGEHNIHHPTIEFESHGGGL